MRQRKKFLRPAAGDAVEFPDGEKFMLADKPSRARARKADPVLHAARLRELALLETANKLKKSTLRELGEAWGLQRTQMERLAAEARRSLAPLFVGKDAEAVRDMLLQRLDMTFAEAFKAGRFAEAIKACAEHGELAGLHVTKLDATVQLTKMTDAELEAEVLREAERIRKERGG